MSIEVQEMGAVWNHLWVLHQAGILQPGVDLPCSAPSALAISSSWAFPAPRPTPGWAFPTGIINNNFHQTLLIPSTANLALFFTLAEFKREQRGLGFWFFSASKSYHSTLLFPPLPQSKFFKKWNHCSHTQYWPREYLFNLTLFLIPHKILLILST